MTRYEVHRMPYSSDNVEIVEYPDAGPSCVIATCPWQHAHKIATALRAQTRIEALQIKAYLVDGDEDEDVL